MVIRKIHVSGEKDSMKTSSYGMNLATMVLIVVFVTVFVYFLSILTMSYLLVPQSAGSTMTDMMGHMMGFSQPSMYFNGILAVALGLGAGLLVAVMLGAFSTAQPIQPTQLSPIQQPIKEVDELKIIRKALSDDERAVVDEVNRAGKITQDSLRFRLGWSKAKVSRILTNLDKMNLIQRERIGKTYNVFLTENKKATD